MNVRAIAGAARFRDRSEAHPVPLSECDRLREFARDHGFIGGTHAERGRGGDLELLRTVLGEEGVGDHSGLAHRREQRFAEGSLAAIGVELIGLGGCTGTPL